MGRPKKKQSGVFDDKTKKTLISTFLDDLLPLYINECPIDEYDNTISIYRFEEYLLSIPEIKAFVLENQFNVVLDNDYDLLFSLFNDAEIKKIIKTVKRLYDIKILTKDEELDYENKSNDEIDFESDSDADEYDSNDKNSSITQIFCKSISQLSEVLPKKEAADVFQSIEDGSKFLFRGIASTPILLEEFLKTIEEPFGTKYPFKVFKTVVKGVDSSVFTPEEIEYLDNLSNKVSHSNAEKMQIELTKKIQEKNNE